MSTEERKLAAIVFTDYCGFTEIMGHDETKAMALLDQHRALLKPIISNFNGEWLKESGQCSRKIGDFRRRREDSNLRKNKTIFL